MKKQSLFLFFALTLRVSPLMRLFRHQQSSFIDVTIALINNIITIIIIIIVIANSRVALRQRKGKDFVFSLFYFIVFYTTQEVHFLYIIYIYIYTPVFKKVFI